MKDPATKRPLRVYTDTSAIGGCFDPEFAPYSMHLLELARRSRVVLVVSDLVFDELMGAPEPVRDIVVQLPPICVERIAISDAMIELRNAYLNAGIVSEKWIDDATHVAAATVSRADAIVSWNFKHIVRLERIKAYNQVNLAHGYGILTIITPREVSDDGTAES